MAETMAASVSLRTSGRSVPVASLLLIMAVMRTAALGHVMLREVVRPG